MNSWTWMEKTQKTQVDTI